jgi:hypothetical protein
MDIKDLGRGSGRVTLIYIIAGVVSLVAVVGLLQFVPISGILGLILAMVVAVLTSYFVCRWLVPFSKYPETVWYKHGRWIGLVIFIFLSGQSVVRNATFVLAHHTESITVWGGHEIALAAALTTILALIAGYIGARDPQASKLTS